MRFFPVVVLLNAYLLAAAPPQPRSSVLVLPASPTPPPPIPALLENEKRAPKSPKSSPQPDKKTPSPTPKSSPKRGGPTPTPTPKSSPKRGGETPTPTPKSSPKRGGQTPTPSPKSSPKATPTPKPAKPNDACKSGKKRMVECDIGEDIKERYLTSGKKANFEDPLDGLEFNLDGANGHSFRLGNKIENIQAWLEQEKKLPNWNDKGIKFTIGERKAKLANRFQDDEFILEQWTSSDGKTLILEKFFNNKYDLYRDYSKQDLEKEYGMFSKEEMDNEEVYIRKGLDPSKTIRLTDQIMFGWQQSIGNKDPKTVGLSTIVHYWVNTITTCNTLNTVIETQGASAKGGDWFEYVKGNAGYTAIAGTVHLQRTAQMMKDHPDIFGKKTITKIRVAPNENADACYDIAVFLG